MKRILTPERMLQLKDASRGIGEMDGEEPLKAMAPIDVHFQAKEGIIEGYTSLFNVFDHYNEVIRPGAFARSIEEDFNGLEVPRIKTLLMHRWSQPIGLPTIMREDSTGLYIEARITESTDEGRKAFALASEGLMDGLSIGFYRRKGGWRELGEDEFDPEELPGSIWWWPTELTDLRVVEFSLVTFPANWGSRVEATRSLERLVVRGWRPEVEEMPELLPEQRSLPEPEETETKDVEPEAEEPEAKAAEDQVETKGAPEPEAEPEEKGAPKFTKEEIEARSAIEALQALVAAEQLKQAFKALEM